ncbi:hypothetical protein [Mahella australiensis]|uniref:TadE family protein n=1 Tax=Mahella australiensis (strain DSM 15567 / CIP 107919 / 50-1 BON) TaxID=697281 RepID=F3ZWT8_MAHA5|nr:hypothetical protein [Mahella australiensis]AEE97560.1 hypothetical protein Mahau_2396 [Mahella australiensis 50-1 BON]
MLRKLITDKRGVSELVSTAAVLLILFLLTGMILQMMALGTAQLTVTASAFSAARAAARSEAPYETAKEAAERYGTGFLKDWIDRLNVTLTAPGGFDPGDRITVEVTYEVPPLFSYFPSPIVRGESTQIMEEIP